MRFYFSGPRLFGGWLRPGVSFDPRELRQLSTPVGAPQPSGNFVYVIKGEHNLCKIGISGNPSARLATLRTASPYPLDFAFVGVTPGSGLDIEQAAHAMLAGQRMNGEWFDAPVALAVAAVQSGAFQIGQKLLPVDVAQADEIVRRIAALPAQGRQRPPFILRHFWAVVGTTFVATWLWVFHKLSS